MVQFQARPLAIIAGLMLLGWASPCSAKDGDGLCIWNHLEPDTRKLLSSQPPTPEVLVSNTVPLFEATSACGATLNYQLIGDMASTQRYGDQLVAGGISLGVVTSRWNGLPAAVRTRLDKIMLDTAPLVGDDLQFFGATVQAVSRGAKDGGDPDTPGVQLIASWLTAIVLLRRDEAR